MGTWRIGIYLGVVSFIALCVVFYSNFFYRPAVLVERVERDGDTTYHLLREKRFDDFPGAEGRETLLDHSEYIDSLLFYQAEPEPPEMGAVVVFRYRITGVRTPRPEMAADAEGWNPRRPPRPPEKKDD